ncbi:MAG TPA: TIGR02996 domain-containing protein [Myxococcus sp.]|nr:TIGR02996 domain-containing protein [Myxococcus sp.]
MRNTVTGLLERAVESYEQHEDEEALQRLLEAWRELRAERIAELAERLSKQANGTAPRAGLLGVQREFGRVLDLEKEGRFPAESVVSLLEDFGRQPADPRLTLGLLDLASRPVAHEERVFPALCELFLHMKDPCALMPLHLLLASLPHGSRYARWLQLTLERMNVGQAPTPRGEEAALCDALKDAMDRRRESLDPRLGWTSLRRELFARVHAAPDDVGARLVLADHLLEQDDPLGELIALQCQPQPDEARVASLLKQHGMEWEMALLGRDVELGRTRFERGLPVAARMTRLGPSPPGPSWCTVRELDLHWRPEAQVEWLAHPHLRNVTVLRGVICGDAALLGTHPLPVRRLVMSGNAATVNPEVFNALSALPHLTWLELAVGEPEDVRLCAASPLASRLERFEATRFGVWSLGVAPAAEMPVEATLVNEERCEEFAQLLQAAAGFSTRALRIRTRLRLTPDTLRMLEGATSGYLRVERDLPPGSG